MNLDDIQKALREEGLDGWLFFDHHGRDPLAYRVLGLDPNLHCTRRWYYLIPASGEPRGLMHRIEPHSLAGLPGEMQFYSRWTEQTAAVGTLLKGLRRVAMQYSPNCVLPYVAMVDAGTIELIRSLGVEVVSSANLIQMFEARWSDQQLESHLEAGRRMDRLRLAAFRKIGQEIRANQPVSEWQIQQFLMDQYAAEGLVTDHGPIVAVNQHASDPHYSPPQQGSSQINKGDFVLIDMWSKLDQPGAVYYDITWTGFCGLPPSEIENVFDVVRGGRDRAIALVKESVASKRTIAGFEVDDAARDWITAKGFGEFFIHRTGHSIGTEVHGSGANMDNFESHDERRIIPRTCFSVEPGVYLPKFGIRSEVDVYVGETAAQVTGEAQTRLVHILDI
jgi:Xaa-Pro dipeptidase